MAETRTVARAGLRLGTALRRQGGTLSRASEPHVPVRGVCPAHSLPVLVSTRTSCFSADTWERGVRAAHCQRLPWPVEVTPSPFWGPRRPAGSGSAPRTHSHTFVSPWSLGIRASRSECSALFRVSLSHRPPSLTSKRPPSLKSEGLLLSPTHVPA